MALENPDEHFLGEVDQKILIEKKGKILVCRAPGSEWWDIPGGRLHKGEDLYEGLKREVREEFSIDIEIGDPYHLCWIPEKQGIHPARYFVVFKGKMADEDQEIVIAEDELEEYKWVTREEAVTLKTNDDWEQLFKKYLNEK